MRIQQMANIARPSDIKDLEDMILYTSRLADAINSLTLQLNSIQESIIAMQIQVNTIQSGLDS